jgi:ABC-2 type transport system permease protein
MTTTKTRSVDDARSVAGATAYRTVARAVRQGGTIAKYELLILSRERLFFVLLFAMPVLLIAVAAGSRGPVADAPAGVVPRYAVAFAFTVTSYTGTAFFRDTWWNSWQRTRTLPCPAATLVLGRAAPAFAAGCVQLSMLLIGGRLVLGMPINGSLSALVVLMLLTVLSASALGFVLSCVARTTSEMSQLSYLVVVVGGVLSGAFNPAGSLPAWCRAPRLVFPQYWAVRGLEQVTAQQATAADVSRCILVLALMVAILVVTGLRLFDLDRVSSR